MSAIPKKKMGRGAKIALGLTVIAGAGIGYYLYSKSGGLSSLTGQTIPDYSLAGPTYTQVTPPTDGGGGGGGPGTTGGGGVPNLGGGYSGGSGGVTDLSWLKDLITKLGPTPSPMVSNPPTPVPTPVPKPVVTPTYNPPSDQNVAFATGVLHATLPIIGNPRQYDVVYQAGLAVGEIAAMGPFGVPVYLGKQLGQYVAPSLYQGISNFFNLPTVYAQPTPTPAPTQIPQGPAIKYTPPMTGGGGAYNV